MPDLSDHDAPDARGAPRAAVCRWCEREMRTTSSCTVTVLHCGGTPTAMIPWGRERRRPASSRCHDCGVLPGGFHHLGCDIQRCPMCDERMISCGCRFDEDEEDDLSIDSNGCLTERVWLGGQEVVIHYDDIPEKDVTTVRGIPCTTALRTVIDIAPSVDWPQLNSIVQDCLDRRLFTEEEARARLAEADMRSRPGAELLRQVLRQ